MHSRGCRNWCGFPYVLVHCFRRRHFDISTSPQNADSGFAGEEMPEVLLMISGSDDGEPYYKNLQVLETYFPDLALSEQSTAVALPRNWIKSAGARTKRPPMEPHDFENASFQVRGSVYLVRLGAHLLRQVDQVLNRIQARHSPRIGSGKC